MSTNSCGIAIAKQIRGMDVPVSLLLAFICSTIVQTGIYGPGLDVAGAIQGTIIFATFATITLVLTMGLGRIVGYAKTSFHHGREGVTLHAKDGRSISFPELVIAAY